MINLIMKSHEINTTKIPLGPTKTSYDISSRYIAEIYKNLISVKLLKCIQIKDGNPNPTTFLDQERIRIRIINLNCGFRLLIFFYKF